MKIIILFAAFGAALAGKATFFADLDAGRFKTPSTFEGEVDGQEVDVEFVQTCGTGAANDFVTDSRGVAGSAQKFDQCEFYRVPAPNGPDSCTADVDQCTKGFSIVAEVKPERPTRDGGSVSWLLQFGFGNDADFGIKVGFQNAQVVVRVITEKRISEIECQLDPAVEEWYTLTVIRGPRVNGDIRIFQNGTRLRDCPTQSKRNNNVGLPSVKRNEIVIGAAKNEAIDPVIPINALFAGYLGQVCFFQEPIDRKDRRLSKDDGCSAV